MISDRQIADMIMPPTENFSKKASVVKPMVLKNLRKAGTSQINVARRMSKTNAESTIRSVTTVPRETGKEVPSTFFSVAQREISPMRGMMRLAAKDIYTADMQLRREGYSCSGSKASRQRNPLRICGMTPNKSEKSIQSQCTPSISVSETCEKGKSLYIQ